MVEVGGYLARTQERQRRLPEALATIDSAIDANKQIPDELYFVPRDLAIKADIEYQLGHAREAEALYQKGTVLIDAMLAHVPTRTVERLLLTELSEVYTGYFTAMSGEHNYSAALRVLEEARGRIEAQALLHHEPIQPHAPTPQEQKLTKLNLALIDTDQEAARQAITRDIYDTELGLYDDNSFEGITATRPIALSRLQRVLTGDELLIEYVLAKPHSFALAVTHTSVDVYQLVDQDRIEGEVAAYSDQLRGKRTDDALAARLYDDLLGPAKELAQKPRLIVIPDGTLHLLPFEALVHDKKYLIATRTVSVAPCSDRIGHPSQW